MTNREVTDAMVTKALAATLPGGSIVSDCLRPASNELQAEVMRAALEAVTPRDSFNGSNAALVSAVDSFLVAGRVDGLARGLLESCASRLRTFGCCGQGRRMPTDSRRVVYADGSVIYWCTVCTAAINRDLYPPEDAQK